MFDFDLQHGTRRCAATGSELKPGETYYAVLKYVGKELRREDFSAAAWNGPPEECAAWWRAHVPLPNAPQKPRLAPNDVLLQLFDQFSERPEQADMRYVLSLLLIRRRLLRVEQSVRDAAGIEQLHLYCPRNECEYHLPAIVPDDARVREIQNELGRLLYSTQE